MTEYRTIDGLDNNLTEPEFGSTDEWFLRFTTVDYGDGFSSPAGEDRPSAREISNVIFDQEESIPNEEGANDLLWLWGQFVDHDITLTQSSTTPEAFDIAVPLGDPYFDPFMTGEAVIPLTRSGFDETTGIDSPREQVNGITAFIDASMIYGSDQARQEFLRDEGGKLKISDGDLLPYNTDGFPNAGGDDNTNLFLAGDVRANENVGLTSFHVLFVREHNRLVDEIAAANPEFDAETLYQEAKMMVEAKIQAITYNEFLPLLLGENALPEYTGYDPNIDPGIANVFATAAYRLGHTLLSSTILRVDEFGNESEFGHLELRDAFFRPDRLVNEGGVDSILRGMAENMSEEVDAQFVDDVRNFLFGPPGAGGFDLAALNIQRGREHGLPDYNTVRTDYGLDPVSDFADITSDMDLQNALEELYGTVDNIDVLVGGLAEDHTDGSMLGELFHTILVDQFTRLRDGDRFWYENRLTPEQIAEVEGTTLSDIIKLNTDIEYLQEHIFLAYDRIGGTEKNDHLKGDEGRDLIIGFAGNDLIKGNGNEDSLYGGDGNDRIYGGDGDDFIAGGSGNNMLIGGEGADTFYFELDSDGTAHDKILDFAANDILQFSGDVDSIEDLDAAVDSVSGNNRVITFNFTNGSSLMLVGMTSGVDSFASLETIMDPAVQNIEFT